MMMTMRKRTASKLTMMLYTFYKSFVKLALCLGVPDGLV